MSNKYFWYIDSGGSWCPTSGYAYEDVFTLQRSMDQYFGNLGFSEPQLSSAESGWTLSNTYASGEKYSWPIVNSSSIEIGTAFYYKIYPVSEAITGFEIEVGNSGKVPPEVQEAP